jgi:protein-tyrosine phosphatase
MIDLHAHILPGVDDGADEWSKSVKMLTRAVEDGITDIVATPHVLPGINDNDCGKVTHMIGELRRHSAELPVNVYPGSEIVVSRDSIEGIISGRYCTINFTRYVLVELPFHFPNEAVFDFVYELTSKGFVPIFAHPERNPKVLRDIDILYELVRLGALMQVTAGSLTGDFGGQVRKLAVEMLNRRLAHVIASDAHSVGKRPPVLSGGLAAAAKILGDKDASALVREIPQMILNDERFEAEEPSAKKKRFGFIRR